MNETSIVIARFTSRHEGEMALELLRGAGVGAAALLTDDGGGSEPMLAYTRPARLAVPFKDLERAKQVLEDAGFETI